MRCLLLALAACGSPGLHPDAALDDGTPPPDAGYVDGPFGELSTVLDANEWY